MDEARPLPATGAASFVSHPAGVDTRAIFGNFSHAAKDLSAGGLPWRIEIDNEADYRAALALADSLFDAEPGTPEGDHLDALVTLIEAYEDRHWPMDAPDPIDAIRVRMAEMNLRPRDLEPMIGTRGRVSEILTRKRPLTLPMIRRLSKGLDLPAEILIQEIRQPRPPRLLSRKPVVERKSAPRAEPRDS